MYMPHTLQYPALFSKNAMYSQEHGKVEIEEVLRENIPAKFPQESWEYCLELGVCGGRTCYRVG
jgi:hypothetical protein